MSDAATPDLSITSRQRALILTGTLMGMLVAAINQTTVTTVLPEIAQDLDGFDLYTWVFTASMLASAVAVPIFGKMSDLYGRRRLFIAGTTIFLLGTVACALAQSMEQLVGARVVQGIGMGAIMPLAMAIIADVVPASDRGKWQGIMGAVFGLATVLGPLAGGSISDHFGWRWIFWVNLPLGLVALATIVTQLHLPFIPRRARIDWLGAVTLGGGLITMLLALSEGGKADHAWDSAFIVSLLVAAAVLFTTFVLVELRADEPIIPMTMLTERNVALTSIAGLGIGAGMFAGIFYVPLFMQTVVGVSASSGGLALVPLMFGLILSSTISGFVITRTQRYKAIIVLGPALAAVGLLLMSRMGADASVFDAAWRMFVVGLGLGMAMQNLMLVAQNSVDLRDTGVVTSLATLMRSVGGTVGIAVLGTVLATQLPIDIAERTSKVEGAREALSSGGFDSGQILNLRSAGLPGPVEEAVRLGIADTLMHVFLMGIPFLAVSLVATLLLRRDPLSDRSAVRVVDELEHELADLVPIDAGHASPMPTPRR